MAQGALDKAIQHVKQTKQFRHPMGPLMLADFIGLDVLCKGTTSMFEAYQDSRYAPPPLLIQMVRLGYIGRKVGKGFYDWSDSKNPVPLALKLLEHKV